MDLARLLKELVDSGGSDLHVKCGRPPLLRLRGELLATDSPVVSREEMEQMLRTVVSPLQLGKLTEERELDFSYLVEGLGRFRGNIFYQMGLPGAVFRAIPTKIKTVDELKLPPALKQIAEKRQGIILVTGPTGSGKSSTLAAIINLINESRHDHIITIEDPVEFVHIDKSCTINQREVGSDTRSFSEALKRALRQDPDIILVGEMRDPETISIAMTAAETGHLVLSTLHTNDAKQSIDRVIDSFSSDQQHQVRMQLAMTLSAVISQKLAKTSDGKGRIAVVEIMINTPTIRKLIEDGRTGMIDKAIAESALLYNMQTMNQHLFELVRGGIITREEAVSTSKNPNDLKIMLETQSQEPKAEGASQEAKGPSLGQRPSPFGKRP